MSLTLSNLLVLLIALWRTVCILPPRNVVLFCRISDVYSFFRQTCLPCCEVRSNSRANIFRRVKVQIWTSKTVRQRELRNEPIDYPIASLLQNFLTKTYSAVQSPVSALITCKELHSTT